MKHKPKYALCIKSNDNNLLHIIKIDDLKSSMYASYQIVLSAKDEAAAFAAVADIVLQFCSTGQEITVGTFKEWLMNSRWRL